MSASRWLGLALAAISLTCSAQQEAAVALAEKPLPRVQVGVPNNVFAKLNQGRPMGVMLEAVDQIVHDMGLQPVYISMPASEIPRALDAGQIDIAAVRILSSRNKGTALYSEPLVDEYNVLAVRAGEGFTAKNLGDLKGKTIAGREGYQYPLLEKNKDIKLLRFDSDGAVIRALLFKQVDMVILAALTDIFVFRTEGVMRHLEVLEASVGMVPLRSAFSSRRFTQADVDQFNQKWLALKASPAWQEIMERNGFADLIREWPLLVE